MAPYSMIVIGVTVAMLASLAVVETRGMSVAPAGAGIESFEPRVGQLTYYAPPYCNADALCLGLNIAIQRLNLQIGFLVELGVRFPRLAPVMSRVVRVLKAVQRTLIRIQNRRFGT
jgi:hypothetical protein